MTEIEENNALIAKFMGLQLPLSLLDYSAMICLNNGYYHNSYNWLILAVEKIMKFETDVFHTIFQIDNSSVYLCIWNKNIPGDKNQIHNYIDIKDNNLIEAIYKAVIYFIKWWNNEYRKEN